MAIDPIGKKISEGEVKSKIDYSDPEVVSILQKGTVQDIKKVLGVTDKDLEQFVTGQWNKYTDVIQSYPLYEQAATVAAPSIDDFAMQDESNALSEADIKLAGEMMSGKVMAAGKASGEGSGSEADLEGAKKHVNDWNNFWNTVMEPKIIEAQLEQQSVQARANVQQKIQELMARKDLDPTTILFLASGASNFLENGLLVSRLGGELMSLNKQANRITETLKGSASFDKDVMVAQQNLKNISLTSQTIALQLNQAVGGIANASNIIKSGLDLLYSGRMEMVRKISPP